MASFRTRSSDEQTAYSGVNDQERFLTLLLLSTLNLET
jgi:hypothetical protein